METQIFHHTKKKSLDKNRPILPRVQNPLSYYTLSWIWTQYLCLGSQGQQRQQWSIHRYIEDLSIFAKWPAWILEAMKMAPCIWQNKASVSRRAAYTSCLSLQIVQPWPWALMKLGLNSILSWACPYFNLGSTLLCTTNDKFPSYYVPIWLSIIHHYLCQCQI
jgi:hypothetical protein